MKVSQEEVSKNLFAELLLGQTSLLNKNKITPQLYYFRVTVKIQLIINCSIQENGAQDLSIRNFPLTRN